MVDKAFIQPTNITSARTSNSNIVSSVLITKAACMIIAPIAISSFSTAQRFSIVVSKQVDMNLLENPITIPLNTINRAFTQVITTFPAVYKKQSEARFTYGQIWPRGLKQP